MRKSHPIFVCTECGTESHKWFGRCPGCQAWNSLVEERPVKDRAEFSRSGFSLASGGQPIPITEARGGTESRVGTGLAELDRVLGGGVVPGSLVLVGGEPGIGKSTLLLQVAGLWSEDQGRVLYVSGEESVEQIKLRADRLGIGTDQLFVVTENNIPGIIAMAEELQPTLLILDSIQTAYCPDLTSAPGSVAQVRQATAELLRWGKTAQVSVWLIGHVTKAGSLAGPKVLEHMVDTVLSFEGDNAQFYRIIRATKNRFGSTNEIGVFEMRDSGLVEVNNPSQLFISQRAAGSTGSTVVSTIEGTRPILVEIQALTARAGFAGTARRQSIGFDHGRVAILLAVLEKRAGLHLEDHDVYVNVAGGVRIAEPAVDLGVALAIASSFRNLPVDPGLCIIGEVGLSGEVRRVSRVEARLTEAAKLGFKEAVVPKANCKECRNFERLRLIGVENIGEALDYAVSR